MTDAPQFREILPLHLNDNKILNAVAELKHSKSPANRVVLVSKDINMRLKARACGIDAEDYHTDQLVTDINQLHKGYIEFPGSFWDGIQSVDTEQSQTGETFHRLGRDSIAFDVYPNQYFLDDAGFIGRVIEVDEHVVVLKHQDRERMLQREAWGI